MEATLKPGTYFFISMLLVGALGSPPAQSQEVKAGDLVISQPWSAQRRAARKPRAAI